MRPKRKLAFIIVIALATTVLGACAGGSGKESDEKGDHAAAGPGELQVSAKEFSFQPSQLTADAGSIDVHFTNAGVIEHDFTIEGSGGPLAAAPGQTTEKSFELAAGTYTFFCSVPGHRQSGMTGTVTVA